MSCGLPSLPYRDFSRQIFEQRVSQGKPVTAQIELTYGCNLHCVHCYTDCYNRSDLIKQKELPAAEIIRILDELRAEGILWVCFTGGDIFVRRDFMEIYAHAKQKGFLITLFTNGTLFTEKIVDFLKENPPFAIEISCHGATEETFDKVTQVKGSFRRFLHGLELLKSRGLAFKLKSSAMTINRHEFVQLKKFIESFGCKFQMDPSIYPRLNGDLEPTRYRLPPEEAVKLSTAEETKDTSCQARGNGPAALGPPASDALFRCGCGQTGVHVNAWGELGTCTWVYEARSSLKENSVAQAIGAVFPKIREMRYQSDSPCKTCHVHSFCDKMTSAFHLETGDGEKPIKHFCDTAVGLAQHTLGRPVAHPLE